MIKCVVTGVLLGKDLKSYFLQVDVQSEFVLEGYSLQEKRMVYLGTKDPKTAFDKAIKAKKILEIPKDRVF